MASIAPHRRVTAPCLIVLMLAAAGSAAAQAANKSNGEVLTNQTIVQLVLAKLPRDVILAKIQSSKTDFDVTVSGLAQLEANKVPVEVMKAMMSSNPKKTSSEVLTNESVMQMVTAHVPHDIILAKIQGTKTNFDISSTGLVNLNSNKVPKDIIKVMMATGG